MMETAAGKRLLSGSTGLQLGTERGALGFGVPWGLGCLGTAGEEIDRWLKMS